MMVSDFFSLIAGLSHLDASILIPFVPFALVAWLFAKLFQALVLRGGVVALGIAGAILWLITQGFWNEGQYVLSLLPVVPLIFVGREGYRRLLSHE